MKSNKHDRMCSEVNTVCLGIHTPLIIHKSSKIRKHTIFHSKIIIKYKDVFVTIAPIPFQEIKLRNTRRNNSHIFDQ